MASATTSINPVSSGKTSAEISRDKASKTQKDSDDKNIEVFVVKTQDEAYAKAREIATERQIQIANEVANTLDNRISNKSLAVGLLSAATAIFAITAAGVGIFASAPLWVPLAIGGAAVASLAGGVGTVCSIASDTKYKSGNLSFKRDAQTTTKDAEKEEYVEKTKIEEFVRSKWMAGEQSKFSQELVEDAAKKLFGDNTEKRLFIMIKSDSDKQKTSNVSLIESIIDSKKYNNVPKDDGEIPGLKKNVFAIESEYENFLDYYTTERLSNGEADKLAKISKALTTKDIYKGQKENEDEDMSFFDINNDGYINDKDKMYFYDILKNGNESENEKADINSDGRIDKKDSDLLIYYLRGNENKLMNRRDSVAALNEAMGR